MISLSATSANISIASFTTVIGALVGIASQNKLNNIESAISKALVDNEFSHQEFTTIINEEANYHKLKESIKMMKSQRSYT